MSESLDDFRYHFLCNAGVYYPSRGKEAARRNNQIRQWMATLALCRLAEYRKDPAIFAVAARNLRYNLSKFFERRGPLGLIHDRDKVKLGAVALAVMAIASHPARDEFRNEEDSLWRTIHFLWQESGEFQTFLIPKARNDLHNFYPGEALLAWSLRYRETREPELLARFIQSFSYYRDWHRKNRNPAFVPWHTQAYYAIWQQTEERELQDFIFEMNDWLVEIQQWETESVRRGRGLRGQTPGSIVNVSWSVLLDGWGKASWYGNAGRLKTGGGITDAVSSATVGARLVAMSATTCPAQFTRS